MLVRHLTVLCNWRICEYRSFCIQRSFSKKKKRKTETSVCDIYAFQSQNWTLQRCTLSKTSWMFYLIIFSVCFIMHACLLYTLLLFLFSAHVYICHTLRKWLLTKQYFWFSRNPLVLWHIFCVSKLPQKYNLYKNNQQIS